VIVTDRNWHKSHGPLPIFLWCGEICFWQSALTDGAQSRTFCDTDYLLVHYALYSAIKRNCRCLLSVKQIKLLVPPHKLRGDADPGVTTQKLETAVASFISEACGHRDLQSTFRNMELAGSWNAAPSKFVGHIAKLKRFYKLVFGVCRNGLLPVKMLEEALKNLENAEDGQGGRIYHWNFSNRPLDQAASALGSIMRIGASKLRDLAESPRLMQISLAGASGETCECIREICAMLKLDPMAVQESRARRRRVDTIAAARSPTAPVKLEPTTGVVPAPSEFDDTGCNMEIFYKALSGEFGKVPSVRRASSVGSTATCSTSLNPLDGFPGRPTPPSEASLADTYLSWGMTPSKVPPQTPLNWDDSQLQVVPYTKQVQNVGASLARRLSFSMEADTTPKAKRSLHGDTASDLPSGEKLLKPGDAGTHLFGGSNMPGPSVAETFVEMARLKLQPKAPVNATRRTKSKKAGGPVQYTVQRTKPKNAKGPEQLKRVIVSSRSTLPSPNTQVNEPRRCHCCRAYRKAYRQARTDGKAESLLRLYAQAAYKKAGREFDSMRSSGKCS